MDNQNINNEREPLPTFDAAPDFTAATTVEAAPAREIPTYEAPVNEAPEEPAAPERDPMIDVLAGQAFSKGLASVILSQFPIASIIGLILGSKGVKSANMARDLANAQGVKGGGKYMVGRILSTIGKFMSLFYTIFWALYGAFFALYGFLILLSAII